MLKTLYRNHFFRKEVLHLASYLKVSLNPLKLTQYYKCYVIHADTVLKFT